MVLDFAEPSLAQADTSKGDGLASIDQFKLTLGDIDRQMEAHEKSEQSESYLGRAFDFIWRQDENSLEKLREMRARVEDLQKRGFAEEELSGRPREDAGGCAPADREGRQGGQAPGEYQFLW